MLKFHSKAKDKSDLIAAILVQEMSSTITLWRRGNDSGSDVLISEFRNTFEVCLNNFLAAVFTDIWERGEIISKMKSGLSTKYILKREKGNN